MAILLAGKTRCPMCGNVIAQTDDTFLFPHLILNEKDPLFHLSDSSCHLQCVNSDHRGRKMLSLTDECFERTGPGKRACATCDDQITDPDDYLLVAYLAEPSFDPLGKFNYTHLHRSHIAGWARAKEFLTLAKAALDAGRWQGEALAEIVREVEAGGRRHVCS